MADEVDDFEQQEIDEEFQEEDTLQEARRAARPRAPKLRWKRVRSSNVHSIAYNPNEAILYVKFLDMSVYCYYDVEEETWSDFVIAPSKGRFVWQRLRDIYEYDRIQ